jgi:lipopolysaccharide cholinephosphotransferase
MKELTDEEIEYVQGKLFLLLKAFRDICDSENIWYSLAFGTVLGAVRHQGFIPWDTDADVFIMLPDKESFRAAYKKHKPAGIRLIDCSTEYHCLQSHDSLVFEDEQRIGSIHLDIFQLVGAPTGHKEQNRFAKYAHYVDKILRSKYVNIADVRPNNKLKVMTVKGILALIPDPLLKRNIHNREYKYDFNDSEYLIPLSGYGRGRECLSKNLFDEMIQASFCGEKFNIPKNYDAYLRQLYGDDYMTPRRY